MFVQLTGAVMLIRFHIAVVPAGVFRAAPTVAAGGQKQRRPERKTETAFFVVSFSARPFPWSQCYAQPNSEGGRKDRRIC